jgi:hypothetical protein
MNTQSGVTVIIFKVEPTAPKNGLYFGRCHLLAKLNNFLGPVDDSAKLSTKH